MSANIYDIAKKAGVSSATVSRYLNRSGYVGKKTAEKIAAVIEEDNFVPNPLARNLSQSRTFRLVGLICCDIEDMYYARAVSVLEKELKRSDYEMILSCSGASVEEKQRSIDTLLSKNADALIFIGSVFMDRSAAVIRETAKKKPCFIINADLTGYNVYCAYADDRAAVEQAVCELYQTGKKNPLFVVDVDTYGSRMKAEGFLRGTEKCGIAPNDGRIVRCDTSFESARKAVKAALESGNYDAALCTNDLLACGALAAAKEAGKSVPGEFAVVGHNNSMITEVTSPPLASIDNKVTELALFTARNLVALFDGTKVAQRKKIPYEIVKRQTFQEEKER